MPILLRTYITTRCLRLARWILWYREFWVLMVGQVWGELNLLPRRGIPRRKLAPPSLTRKEIQHLIFIAGARLHP